MRIAPEECVFLFIMEGFGTISYNFRKMPVRRAADPASPARTLFNRFFRKHTGQSPVEYRKES